MMKLSNDIIRLFKLFNNSGYQLYIIGGAVRDYLLNREICDYDFATNATPNEMMKLLKDYNLDTYQSDLGSIKVHLNNQIYEITTFRKEYGVKDYRYPEKIEYIQNLKEDVIRRDFTINSLAYSLNDGVVDHLNGLSDLKLKLIKFNKDIKVSILEDPIRIIRALRFSLLLNFNILDADLSVMILHADRINNLGKIKYDELLKLFKIKGCKEFIIKYFNIYKKAYPFFDNDIFINILNSNIVEEDLKYCLGYFVADLNYFNKHDMKILKALNDIDICCNDLYRSKLLMIEYKDDLIKILDILSSMGKDVSKIKDNVILVKNEKHCLDISGLDISYKDLENLNINVKEYSKIFKYLLNKVLIDYQLNTNEKLIELIKRGDY